MHMDEQTEFILARIPISGQLPHVYEQNVYNLWLNVSSHDMYNLIESNSLSNLQL